jgi:DNA end-binding protein Ku
MPRSVWKGALSFGLVNVPVGLYSATQDKTIHFNQFEEGTSDRIRYKKVNERTGQEVPAGRIVKGYDLGGGEYVLLTDEELESAEPTKSHLIEITDFVDLDQIDPIFYRATYYLAPEGEAADKAYALLREVMRKANKVAIGTVVMRNKEYTVAIRPDDEVLKLETMYFADEIRSPSRELPSLPSTGAITEREVQMAGLLLESMESDWEPEKYRDTHREKVEALIESKRQGNEIVTGAEAAPPSTKVVDLMEVLSASLESVNASKQAAPAPRATRARSTATPTATAGKKGVAARKAAAPKGTAKRPTPIKGTAKRPTPIKGTAKATKPKTAARRKAS